MRFSFTSLLPLILLIGAVGCYTNIPAESMEPICRIVRETRKSSEYFPSLRVGKERVMVGSETFDVYFTDSVSYSYDLQGRLLREQSQRTNSYTDTKYTYTGSRLNSEFTSYTKNGVIIQVFPYSRTLNERGYDASYQYDEDWIVIRKGIYPAKRVNGNTIQLTVDGAARATTLNYTYDLTHLSLLNPRQFEGRFSRNLLLTESSSGYSCCEPGRSEFRYLFDAQNRVSRRIWLRWYSEFPDGSPPTTVYVTDYEYECR